MRRCILFGVRPLLPGPATGFAKGRVDRNWGFCRAWVTASKPEASLMRVGSLKAVLKNDIPRGTPNDIPDGTLMMG